MSGGGLSEQERFDRLRLARTERVGPVTFDQLLKRYGSAGRALAALPELARRAGGGLRPAAVAGIDREMEAGEALGARLIVVGDKAFPPLLAAVDPPPPILWVRGEPALLSRRSVAIVGARIASAAAQRFARGLAADLGGAGWVVVSGMARGIDAAAHEGSIGCGSVAVLGGGVDDVYPTENAELYRRLCEFGAVVSESPPGAKAQAKDFPRRNRIISGLSAGVVVVEAELKSGSLITARIAAEQSREVFAVPGSPLDPRARGCNDLIRQGATICEGADDVLAVLSNQRPFSEPDQPPFGPSPMSSPALDAEADRIREQVAASLSPTPAPIDEIVRAVDAAPSAVFAALVELSLAGRAELSPGGLVCASRPDD